MIACLLALKFVVIFWMVGLLEIELRVWKMEDGNEMDLDIKRIGSRIR